MNIIKNTIDFFDNWKKICETKNEINENLLCFPYNCKIFYLKKIIIYFENNYSKFLLF